MKLSFIIPYRYQIEREKLLEATILNLPQWDNIEICIVELDKEPYFKNTHNSYKILSKLYNIKYYFNYYEGVFHKALAINIGAKYLAVGKIFCILDGDIVFRYQEDVLCDIFKYGTSPCSAFHSMYFMDQKETKFFLIHGIFPSRHPKEKMRFSSLGGLVGGLIIIPKNIFMEIKGVPEMFKGTWGKDDNALWMRLKAHGYNFRSLARCFYHLYHLHKTEKNQEITEQINVIKNWTILDWKKYDEKIGDNWGKK